MMKDKSNVKMRGVLYIYIVRCVYYKSSENVPLGTAGG